MTTKTAQSIPQSYKVFNYGTLPDGEQFVEVNCPNYDFYTALPAGMEFEGKVYTQTGWNSDLQLAYYKAGKKFATGVAVPSKV